MNQNMFLFLNTQKMRAKEQSIMAMMMAQAHEEWPINQPNWTFMPKKLAISVGGMSISETKVNTFIILFWSRLMIPITVF